MCALFSSSSEGVCSSEDCIDFCLLAGRGIAASDIVIDVEPCVILCGSVELWTGSCICCDG